MNGSTRRRGAPLAAAAAAAFLMLLASCGSTSSTEGPVTPSDASSEQNPEPSDPTESDDTSPVAAIQIAEQLPLSGDNADLGVETDKGIQLGIEEINAAGGINGAQIEITQYDDKCEATQSSAVANRVVSDADYVAVIGNVCSGAALAALPIYQRENIPVLASATSLPDLSKKGFNNFARVVATDEFQAAQVTKLAVTGLGAKALAVVYSNDDLGQSIFEITKATAEAEGATIVANETYITSQQQDFSAILANVAASHPDAIILGGYYAEMADIVRQSTRAFSDERPLMVGGGQLMEPKFLELAGAAADGVYISTLYDSANPSEVNQKFVEAYSAKFGERPGVQAALGYATAYIIAEALTQASGQYDDLANIIRNIDYTGPIGKVEFDEFGDNIAGSTVVEVVKGGAFTVDADMTEKTSS